MRKPVDKKEFTNTVKKSYINKNYFGSKPNP